MYILNKEKHVNKSTFTVFHSKQQQRPQLEFMSFSSEKTEIRPVRSNKFIIKEQPLDNLKDCSFVMAVFAFVDFCTKSRFYGILVNF